MYRRPGLRSRSAIGARKPGCCRSFAAASVEVEHKRIEARAALSVVFRGDWIFSKVAFFDAVNHILKRRTAHGGEIRGTENFAARERIGELCFQSLAHF